MRSEELGMRSEELGMRSEELGMRSEELGIRDEKLGMESREVSRLSFFLCLFVEEMWGRGLFVICCMVYL